MIAGQSTAQNISDNFLSYSPNTYHSQDDHVLLEKGDSARWEQKLIGQLDEVFVDCSYLDIGARLWYLSTPHRFAQTSSC